MQPKNTTRISFDIGQRLWNKLDRAADNPGDKRAIVEAALEKQLAHIPEPPADYKPKKKKSGGNSQVSLKRLREMYQKQR